MNGKQSKGNGVIESAAKTLINNASLTVLFLDASAICGSLGVEN
jgi:hypothetical protein